MGKIEKVGITACFCRVNCFDEEREGSEVSVQLIFFEGLFLCISHCSGVSGLKLYLHGQVA